MCQANAESTDPGALMEEDLGAYGGAPLRAGLGIGLCVKVQPSYAAPASTMRRLVLSFCGSRSPESSFETFAARAALRVFICFRFPNKSQHWERPNYTSTAREMLE